MSRLLILFFLVLAILGFGLISGPEALAQGRYHVFEVRKNLSMNSHDPIIRDYYINAGARDGLKSGMVVNLIRREPMHDLYSDIQDDLVIPVGRIKLMIVQRTLSIGRLVSTYNPKAGPILDYGTVMTGDRVDLGSATWDDEGDKGNGEKAEDGKGAKGKAKTDAKSEAKPDADPAATEVSGSLVPAEALAPDPMRPASKSDEAKSHDTKAPHTPPQPQTAKAPPAIVPPAPPKLILPEKKKEEPPPIDEASLFEDEPSEPILFTQ